MQAFEMPARWEFPRSPLRLVFEHSAAQADGPAQAIIQEQNIRQFGWHRRAYDYPLIAPIRRVNYGPVVAHSPPVIAVREENVAHLEFILHLEELFPGLAAICGLDHAPAAA